MDPPIVLYAVAMAGATCVQRMENLVAVVLVQCAHLSASDAAMQSALFHVAVFATISIVTPFYSGLGVRSKAVLMIGLNALGCACIVCLVHLTSASSQALHNSRVWYALALNGLLAAAGSCWFPNKVAAAAELSPLASNPLALDMAWWSSTALTMASPSVSAASNSSVSNATTKVATRVDSAPCSCPK